MFRLGIRVLHTKKPPQIPRLYYAPVPIYTGRQGRTSWYNTRQPDQHVHGKLLITPTHQLKLVVDVPKRREPKGDREPVAILLHPRQPLSHLASLLQAELPPPAGHPESQPPPVRFFAEAPRDASDAHGTAGYDLGASAPNITSYSGLGHEGPRRGDRGWVRWGLSTDLGDFIREAARGREFAVAIDGSSERIYVDVPSFRDLTHYLRQRLRATSRAVDEMSKTKLECDKLAHRGALWLARSGLGAMVSWWGLVYYLTFMTEYGWDLVEPVTYLAGLTIIMGGYVWFLYMSRDISYRTAMNVTVSRRQHALYQARGFDLAKWQRLVAEANSLRAEIGAIAREYHVDWDEAEDLGGEDVKRVLESEEKKRGKGENEPDRGDAKVGETGNGGDRAEEGGQDGSGHNQKS